MSPARSRPTVALPSGRSRDDRRVEALRATGRLRVERQGQLVQRHGQGHLRGGARRRRHPEVQRSEDVRQHRTGDQQHRVPSGTFGGAGAERDQLWMLTGPPVQPDLGHESMREGQQFCRHGERPG